MSDGTASYMRITTPRGAGRGPAEEDAPAHPETLGPCDVRELLFTVSFVATVTKMGQNLSASSDDHNFDAASKFNNGDFMIYFLGVFIFWADTTQLRNRWHCPPQAGSWLSPELQVGL